MNLLSKPLKSLFAIAVIVACQPAWAAGQTLDSSQSTINFISVKNEHVVETHRFNRFEGEISESGAVSISIDLSSVDTGIEIRDTRLQRELFKTDAYPSAAIQATVDPSVFTSKNSTQLITVDGTLDLHGNSQPLSLMLRVVTMDDGTILVHNTQPVIIAAEAYGLVDGIAKLAELAGGISIGKSVPVNFSLHFTP